MSISEDVTATLRAQDHGHPPVVCYTEKRFFEWHEDEVGVSLRSCSGSYGGGSEVFVIAQKSAEVSPTMTTKDQTGNMWSRES